MQRRSWMAATFLVVAAAAVPSACGRKSAEVNPIVPAFGANRMKAPLGSAIEATYTFTVEATARKLAQDYRVLVQFLDSHKVILFTDDHLPPVPTSAWEAGKTYTWKRTVFIPVYPYVGDVQVVMGLYPAQGRGERPALKGEDSGLHAYKVAKMEFLPQTENIFLVYKDGWHNPEAMPQNPGVERTWTKKEALVSFKNPKKDVVLYLEADTCTKCYPEPAVLTVSVNNKVGTRVPIETAELFLKKVRIKAEDLGSEDWVDLRLSMNQAFVPKQLPELFKGSTDDRELGVLVYHLFVGEADKLGEIPADTVVEASAIAPAPAAKPAVAKPPATPAAKPAVTPAPKKS
ncbi:MAG TPA: hypothetical protein VFM88_03605 [Vicinamibacteria bacterium]|nr:hypothetical protein [Vicinamibacteria bacterium]